MPEAGPNAVEPPGRPLGLSAGNIASESGHDTSSSFASESAKPEKADVPKLESAAPDQSGRPLGLSDAGSAARSFSGTLLQPLFGFLCACSSLCFLHALALSLTGA